MDEQDIKTLISRYNNGTASPDERNWLDNWYRAEASGQQLSPDELPLPEQEEWLLQGTLERAGLYQQAPVRRMWPRIAAAASILIAVGASAWFLTHSAAPSKPITLAQTDLNPIQNGVTLTIGKNQPIQLRKAYNGKIAANINQADSTLHYNNAVKTEETNTLTNNGNSKFSVQLADGSAVTLDIGSSLTYPAAFSGTIRLVSLSGQAYFKVKHTPGKRFLVKTGSQVTEDVGTEFNINAYNDEPAIRTTLIEGSVKVNGKTLRPGQQTINANNDITITTADLEEVTAWMQDKIVLEQQTLETIMRRVARVYGVKVIYLDEEVKNYSYGGVVKTSTKLSSVLNFLRKAGGVDFNVEGQQVKVFKKKNK